jgi:hypothetical protein
MKMDFAAEVRRREAKQDMLFSASLRLRGKK